MKILIYSDLHLEFGSTFKPPENCDADLMILAGDIITFKDFQPLKKFLENWDKPVLYVAGNHEYYAKKEISELEKNFERFITDNAININLLRNEDFSSPSVEFFGGTMWTDFNKSDPMAMMLAQQQMNDYRLIYRFKSYKLLPRNTVDAHQQFKEKLIDWLEKNEGKKRVVISHHAPCLNPNSQFKGSKLQAAYNSLDMLEIIEKYQPELWIYGHTHECDDQIIGKTKIISNQFGYYRQQECREFNPNLIIEI